MEEPRMTCQERASCPPKLTDNWRQQGEKNARDERNRGVWVCGTETKTELWAQRGAGMEEKALSSSATKLRAFLIFTCTSINDKIITKQNFKKDSKHIFFLHLYSKTNGLWTSTKMQTRTLRVPPSCTALSLSSKFMAPAPKTLLYPHQFL